MRRVLLLLWLSSLLVFAQTKPNFTGEWKMNPEKSDWGKIPPPASLVRKVDHKDPNMHLVTTVKTEQGEVTTDVKYTTDGKETTNEVRGAKITGAMKWDGPKLVLDAVRPVGNGAEVKTHEYWTLSEDGKTWTSVNKSVTPNGDLVITLVMEKQ